MISLNESVCVGQFAKKSRSNRSFIHSVVFPVAVNHGQTELLPRSHSRFNAHYGQNTPTGFRPTHLDLRRAQEFFIRDHNIAIEPPTKLLPFCTSRQAF